MKVFNDRVKKIGDIKEIFINGSYKYMIGEVKSFDKAMVLLREVKPVIKDSFIVAF